MNFLSQIKTNAYNKCPQCKKRLVNDAVFCGKCGCAISEVNQTDTVNFENKTAWEWISPAIVLWITLLSINGVIGLLAHFLNISSPIYDLSAGILVAVFILIFCYKGKNQIKPFLSFSGFQRIRSYIEAGGALFFIFIFMWCYFELLSFIGVEEMPYLTDYTAHGWPFWSAVIIIGFLPGIFEELAFRGYIMSRLMKVGNEQEALIIQAAMFSILHMLPIIFISHFMIGFTLGLIRIKSKSLYPCMMVHTAWNIIVISREAYVFDILI